MATFCGAETKTKTGCTVSVRNLGIGILLGNVATLDLVIEHD